MAWLACGTLFRPTSSAQFFCAAPSPGGRSSNWRGLPAVNASIWLGARYGSRRGCRRNTRDRRRPGTLALRACAMSTGVASVRKRLAAGGATSLFHRSPQRPLHPLMSASVSVQYAARVAAGKIERDSAQQRIVDRLAKLETELAEQRLARKSSSRGCRSRASTCSAKSVAARPC